MICVDTISVFGGNKMKSQELTFLIFKKVEFFFLKFYIVPTLCDNFSFNNYAGQTLQFNLMNLAFMQGIEPIYLHILSQSISDHHFRCWVWVGAKF